MLSDKLIEAIVPYLDMLGISVHSINNEIKRNIGSCTNKQDVLSNERLIAICKKVREINPSCIIKLNTVVCSENYSEDLSDFLLSKDLNIDKWKFLKCQSFEGNDFMCISDSQFNHFISINDKETNNKKVFEKNMKE